LSRGNSKGREEHFPCCVEGTPESLVGDAQCHCIAPRTVHFGNVQQKSFHHIHVGDFLGELGEERHNSGRIITVEWGGMGSGISDARRWSIRFVYRNVDS